MVKTPRHITPYKRVIKLNESADIKTYKMACAPSKDSDQTGHSPSLIRVFAVRMKKAWVLSYAQADLSLRFAHMPFCWFSHALAQIALPVSPQEHMVWRMRETSIMFCRKWVFIEL